MALKGSKLLSRSAALEDAVVVRCHERCGYGRAPTRWPGGASAFGVVAAARSVAGQLGAERYPWRHVQRTPPSCGRSRCRIGRLS